MPIRTTELLYYLPLSFTINADMSVNVTMRKGFIQSDGTTFQDLSIEYFLIPPEVAQPIFASPASGATRWLDLKNIVYTAMIDIGLISGQIV